MNGKLCSLCKERTSLSYHNWCRRPCKNAKRREDYRKMSPEAKQRSYDEKKRDSQAWKWL